MTLGSLALRFWPPSWKASVVKALQVNGYDSMTEFLDDNPATGYGELAKKLQGVAGIELVPYMLTKIQYGEAMANATFFQSAQDSLVREFCGIMPLGWRNTPDAQIFSKELSVVGIWEDGITSIVGSDFVEFGDKLFDALCDADPEQGWLPQDVEDPILKKAFEACWTEEIDQLVKKLESEYAESKDDSVSPADSES